MPHLSPHDVMTMFMALATLLGCAKLAAELMQKIGQPPILGEISVGIFLGPTVLGHYCPHIYEALFSHHWADADRAGHGDHLRSCVLPAHRRVGDRLAQHLPPRQERAPCEFLWRDFSLCGGLPGC